MTADLLRKKEKENKGTKELNLINNKRTVQGTVAQLGSETTVKSWAFYLAKCWADGRNICLLNIRMKNEKKREGGKVNALKRKVEKSTEVGFSKVTCTLAFPKSAKRWGRYFECNIS